MLSTKWQQLFALFPPSDDVIEQSFIRLQDCGGWTNGHMADLTAAHYDQMLAKATERRSQLSRFTVDGTLPTAKQLLTPTAEHAVDDLEIDQQHKSVRLISSALAVSVNPVYLGYFQKVYGGSRTLAVRLTSPREPVRVYADDELVGLIMPLAQAA
jgi:hypothetical protein